MPRGGAVRMISRPQLRLVDRLERSRHFFPLTAGPSAIRRETSMFDHWVQDRSRSKSENIIHVIRDFDRPIPPPSATIAKRHFILLALPAEGDSAWDSVNACEILAREFNQDASSHGEGGSSIQSFNDVLVFRVQGLEENVLITTNQVLIVPGEIALACNVSFHTSSDVIKMPAIHRGGLQINVKPNRGRTILVIVDSTMSQKDSKVRLESIMTKAIKNPKIMSELVSSLMDPEKLLGFMKMIEDMLGITHEQALEMIEKFKSMDLEKIKQIISSLSKTAETTDQNGNDDQTSDKVICEKKPKMELPSE